MTAVAIEKTAGQWPLQAGDAYLRRARVNDSIA
jgi:hypothetical protein